MVRVINKKIMETKNSVKINVMKSLAIAIALTFTGVTADSQNFLKASDYVTNSTFLLAATELTTVPGNYKIPNELLSWNAYLSTENETALEVENWMISESHFYSPSHLPVEMEKPLELEGWMKNENLFYATISFEVEKEEEMEVESWMLDSKLYESSIEKTERNETINKQESTKSGRKNCHKKRFGTRTFLLKEVKDPELKVEYWMLDYRIWN